MCLALPIHHRLVGSSLASESNLMSEMSEVDGISEASLAYR